MRAAFDRKAGLAQKLRQPAHVVASKVHKYAIKDIEERSVCRNLDDGNTAGSQDLEKMGYRAFVIFDVFQNV
jgi:hypothetical protein